MNERIQELAEQAENYAHEQNDKFGLSYKREYDKKFAELIVRECADIQMKRSCERHGYDKYEDAKEIKQHFGVEE